MPTTRIHNRARRPARMFVQEWMEHRGLNQEQMAGRLETSKSVVSKLVTGKQRWSQDWLEAFAYALDCEVRELYRPPTAPTADELLAGMSPDARDTAIRMLTDLSRLGKTGS